MFTKSEASALVYTMEECVGFRVGLQRFTHKPFMHPSEIYVKSTADNGDKNPESISTCGARTKFLGPIDFPGSF